MTPPQPLLFLHGALYTAEAFNAVRTKLGSTIDHHAITLLGHGTESASDEPLSMDLFINQVIAWMDSHGYQQIDIAGYSMGGYIALMMALRYPERIGCVLTLGTKLRWDSISAEHEASMLDPTTIEEKVPSFAATLSKRHGSLRWRDLLGRTADLIRSLGEVPPLTPATLASIEQPVRLCVGDRDAMVTIEESDEAHRAMPNGELAVFPGTPHLLERISTTRFAHEIEEFIR